MGVMGRESRATLGYKFLLFCLFVLAYLVFYILPNFSPFLHPSMLPQLEIDYSTPLVPWTFVVYISDYFLIFMVILMVQDFEQFNSFARMMFFTLFLCGLFFLFLPTSYPRPPYPMAENPVVRFAMWLVGNYDTPNNCFPSMHVALTGVATWNIRHRGPKTFTFFLIWAVAVFISTLTTKQHYFLDIIGGLAVVATSAAFDKAYAARGILRDRFQKGFIINRS